MCCIGLFSLRSNSPPTCEVSAETVVGCKWKMQWEGANKGDPRKMKWSWQEEQEMGAVGDATNVTLQRGFSWLPQCSLGPTSTVHCPARHGRETAAGVFPAPIASSLCPSFLNFACPHCNHLSSGLLWAAASSESGSRNRPCCSQSQDLQRTNPGQGKDHKLYLHEPKRGDKEIL